MHYNIYPKSDPRHQLFSKFVADIHERKTKYSSTHTAVNSKVVDLKKEIGETLIELNSNLNYLKNHNEDYQTAANFSIISEKLTKFAEAKRNSRDVALKTKAEMKITRANLAAEIDRLKSELRDLDADNKAILDKLKEPTDIPLTCLLMKTVDSESLNDALEPTHT